MHEVREGWIFCAFTAKNKANCSKIEASFFDIEKKNVRKFKKASRELFDEIQYYVSLPHKEIITLKILSHINTHSSWNTTIIMRK